MRVKDDNGRKGRVVLTENEIATVEIDCDPTSAPEDLPRLWVGPLVDLLCGWRPDEKMEDE